jgi:hypothetical protein
LSTWGAARESLPCRFRGAKVKTFWFLTKCSRGIRGFFHGGDPGEGRGDGKLPS